MPLPIIKKDANGNYVVTGVKEQEITQQQAQYNDLVQSAQTITGPEGDAARKLISTNPNASAGLVSSMYKSGMVQSNDLVDTFVAIDAQTKAQREQDIFKEQQRLSTERFNNSLWGTVWTGVKGLSRGVTLAGSTVFELLAGQVRTTGKATENLIEGVKQTLQGKASNDAWVLEGKPIPSYEQTTLYQAAKELATEGKVDLGAGFFPSEETGAGFAARQQAMKVMKVAVERNGKQVKDADGNPIYRPYSPIDPISTLLTFGNPESGVARFVNAIGELGLYVVTDPFLAYSKLASSAKFLREQEAATGAIKSGEKLIIESQLEEAHKATMAAFEEMGIASKATAAEKRLAYEAAFLEETKLAAKYDSLVNGIDYDAISSFLSGSKGAPVIDAIANMDDWQDIYTLSRRGGKSGFTVDESIALASAKTREEVLEKIAPYIANGQVVQNTLERGTTSSRLLSKISKGATPKIANKIDGWAAKAVRRVPVIQRIVSSYNTYVPNQGTFVHFADKDNLISTVINYAKSTNVSEDVTRKIINDIAFATDASKAGYTASAKLFDAIFQANKDKLIKAGIDESRLKELTRVFEKERSKMSSYWAREHASGAYIDYVFANGKKVTISGPHIESELLNSMIYFPPAREIMQEIAKTGAINKATRGISGKILNPVDNFTNNFWKKVVLVRPAYVMRNIAEEQIRVMGTGHISFFNNPVTATAMWLGRDGGPKWRAVLNTFDPFRHTVFGTSFKMASRADELTTEIAAHDASISYINFMNDSSIGAANEVRKVAILNGFQDVEYGHPNFWKGLANEIRILGESGIARAVARTEPGRESDTINYLLRGQGKEDYLRFANAQSDEVKAWLLTDEGARMYLFDGVTETARGARRNVSVRARIEDVAGQDGVSSAAIRRLIGYGSVTGKGYSLNIPKALDSAKNSIRNKEQISKGRKALKDSTEEFADSLKNVFDGKGNWEGIRFKTPASVAASEKEKLDFVTRFFDIATDFEKTTTMGPEWRQSYWDAVATLAGAADAEAIARLQSVAEKSLRPLVGANGLLLGNNHKMWTVFKNVDGSGPLSLDRIHEYASNVANKRVAELFYNASKKRLLWHQMRLIAPFGQAWQDTIYKWGKIGFDNPAQVYKVGKGLDFLTSPMSSPLYEITDAKDYYDPNQGFFFTDPQSGQRNFFIPYLSTFMNLAVNASQFNFSTKGAFATAASPQSFNFAIGGASILPGIGPGYSIGLNILDSLGKNPLDLLPGVWKDRVYKLVYPYGQPSLGAAGGVEATLLSANLARIISGVRGAQESYAGSFAPVMNYLATSGDYNLDSPEDQTRLITDAGNFAKWFTIMRGLFGLGTPTAIQPKDLTRDKDGNDMLASALYADFRRIEKENGSNFNKAYADFLDLYGPEQVFAIISTTSGGPNNLATYQLIMRDPKVVDQYPDVYGYLYPNGGFSQELYKWQLRTGKRQRLTPEEVMEKATNIRYYAAVDRILTRSAAEGWDSKYTDSLVSALGESYNLRGRVLTIDAGKDDRIMDQLKRAAYDERFGDSDGATALRDYLYLRDKAIEASGRKTLKNKSSEPQREFLAQQALELIKKYPDFQKIFYRFFKKELEG